MTTCTSAALAFAPVPVVTQGYFFCAYRIHLAELDHSRVEVRVAPQFQDPVVTMQGHVQDSVVAVVSMFVIGCR